jgi:hypothetical protein
MCRSWRIDGSGPGMGLMDATAYDAWYDTPWGRWIGTAEFRLLSGLLQAQTGDTLLDAGEVCRPGPASTGWTDLGHHGQLLLG